MFLNQREKGYVADVQSTLKNGATAVESAATQTGGDYTAIDETTIANDEGFKDAATQTTTVVGDTDSFCITVVDTRLAGKPWGTATYDSDEGSPSEADTC